MPSTRTSAGCAAAPVPRITDTYVLCVFGCDGDVANRDLRGVGADERGDLLIERRHVLRAGAAGCGAEVNREDRGGLRVGGEQRAVGANASVPMDVSDGPTDVLATSETDVVAAASASTRANLHTVVFIGGSLSMVPGFRGSGVLLALRCALQWAAHRRNLGTPELRNHTVIS